MKKLLILVSIGSLMFFTSCSSTKINDSKIKAAEGLGRAVEKELAEEYASLVIDNDCNAEAKLIGEKAKEKVLELLKAKETVDSSALKSASFASAGGVVPVLCTFVVQSVLPPLIKDGSSEYACLRALGAEKISKVGLDLCNAIDL